MFLGIYQPSSDQRKGGMYIILYIIASNNLNIYFVFVSTLDCNNTLASENK